MKVLRARPTLPVRIRSIRCGPFIPGARPIVCQCPPPRWCRPPLTQRRPVSLPFATRATRAAPVRRRCPAWSPTPTFAGRRAVVSVTTFPSPPGRRLSSKSTSLTRRLRFPPLLRSTKPTEVRRFSSFFFFLPYFFTAYADAAATGSRILVVSNGQVTVSAGTSGNSSSFVATDF